MSLSPQRNASFQNSETDALNPNATLRSTNGRIDELIVRMDELQKKHVELSSSVSEIREMLNTLVQRSVTVENGSADGSETAEIVNGIRNLNLTSGDQVTTAAPSDDSDTEEETIEVEVKDTKSSRALKINWEQRRFNAEHFTSLTSTSTLQEVQRLFDKIAEVTKGYGLDDRSSIVLVQEHIDEPLSMWAEDVIVPSSTFAQVRQDFLTKFETTAPRFNPYVAKILDLRYKNDGLKLYKEFVELLHLLPTDWRQDDVLLHAFHYTLPERIRKRVNHKKCSNFRELYLKLEPIFATEDKTSFPPKGKAQQEERAGPSGTSSKPHQKSGFRKSSNKQNRTGSTSSKN